MARYTIKKETRCGETCFCVSFFAGDVDRYASEKEAKEAIVCVMSGEVSDLGNELNEVNNHKTAIEAEIGDIAKELASLRLSLRLMAEMED